MNFVQSGAVIGIPEQDADHYCPAICSAMSRFQNLRVCGVCVKILEELGG